MLPALLQAPQQERPVVIGDVESEKLLDAALFVGEDATRSTAALLDRGGGLSLFFCFCIVKKRE